MTSRLTIRLNAVEVAALDKLRGDRNPSEYMRYLLLSEHHRRKDGGRGHRPHEGLYASDMRTGRPRQKRQTLSVTTNEQTNRKQICLPH